MTSKGALAQALLKGYVINIDNIHKLTGYTNSGREIGRSIERAFGVKVSRTKKDGVTRFGVYCTWVDYRLNSTPYNKAGIERMIKYVEVQNGIDLKKRSLKFNNKQMSLF